MNAKKCDRCGSFYTENKNKYKEKLNGDCVYGIIVVTKTNRYKIYDLCDSCICEFMKWIGEE